MLHPLVHSSRVTGALADPSARAPKSLIVACVALIGPAACSARDDAGFEVRDAIDDGATETTSPDGTNLDVTIAPDATLTEDVTVDADTTTTSDATGPADVAPDQDATSEAWPIWPGGVPVLPTPNPLPEAYPPSVLERMRFVLEGESPLQRAVAPGALDDVRAAVVRGHVRDAEGHPVGGVQVRVVDAPELGVTATRADGRWDLVVNGGGELLVRFEALGYVAVDRAVSVPWAAWIEAPPVVLVPLGPATVVQLPQDSAVVVAGAESVDADGTRTARLFIPAGVSAELVFRDGRREPAPTLHLRATELTVGPDGAERMPAALPPASAYTYCVEWSADEAVALGAASVAWSEPVAIWVDDFLGLPVGAAVPSGWYDRDAGLWRAGANGLVIEVTEDGLAAAALDADERAELSRTYAAGTRVWRMPIDHFTPWDHNLRFLLDRFGPPDNPPRRDRHKDKPKKRCGSEIGIENQALGESLALGGTPYGLHYQSDRQRGFLAAFALDVPVFDADPADVVTARVQVDIAGRTSEARIAPTPDAVHPYIWDGRDAFGRLVQGAEPVRVRVGYVHPFVYLFSPPADQALWNSWFEGLRIGASTGQRASDLDQMTLWREWDVRSLPTLGVWDPRAQGLGGWTLTVHHAWDRHARRLHLGNGETRSLASLPANHRRVAGQGIGGVGDDGGPARLTYLDRPEGIVAEPDGGYVFGDFRNGLTALKRVTRAGIIDTIAGGRIACPEDWMCTGSLEGDVADVWNVRGLYLARARDGALLFSNGSDIRRLGRDGRITLVAGQAGGCSGFNSAESTCGPGDGHDARLTRLEVGGLALGPDGTIYFSDPHRHRVRKVTPDGILWTVAGTGVAGFAGDGESARAAKLCFPQAVAVDGDGALYVNDVGNHRLRRVRPDGRIETIAGDGDNRVAGDGGRALEASVFETWPETDAFCKSPPASTIGSGAGQLLPGSGLALRADGTIAFVDNARSLQRGIGSVRQIDAAGVITTVLLSPSDAYLWPWGLAWTPDDRLLVTNHYDGDVYVVAPPVPGAPASLADEVELLSEDGRELYRFDGLGRHLRTVDAVDGSVTRTFEYDAASRLVGVTEADGGTTTIARDAAGNPTTLTAPDGSVTTLEVDDDGYLVAVTEPSAIGGKRVTMAYDGGPGLLTRIERPGFGESVHRYDDRGRLLEDTNADGFGTTLGRDDDGTVVATASGGAHTRITSAPGSRVVIAPSGLQTEHVDIGNARSVTYPDGARIDSELGPDPRWGWSAPFATEVIVTRPGIGVEKTVITRSAELADGLAPTSVLRTVETRTVTPNAASLTVTDDRESGTWTRVSAAGRRLVIARDVEGRITGHRRGDLAPVTYTYDDDGALAAIDVGARHYAWSEVAPGSYALTTPRGDVYGVSLTAASATSRLPGGGEVVGAFDGDGRLVSRGAPSGATLQELAYTDGGAVAALVTPHGGTTTYERDAAGRIARIARSGHALDRTFDPAGRLVTATTSHGTTTLSYDPASGHVSSVATSEVTTRVTSTSGLETRVEWSGAVAGAIARTWDAHLRPASLRVNDVGPLAVQVDADGLMTAIGPLRIDWRGDTDLPSRTDVGLVATAYTWNDHGEVERIRAEYAGSPLYELVVARDGDGRITSETTTIDGVTVVREYSYDAAGRLVRVRDDGVETAAYAFDADGHRTSGGASYDAGGRLLALGDATYVHRADGALASRSTSAGTTTWDFDFYGQLRTVTRADGVAIAYVVDGANRRVGKRRDGVLVQGLLYGDARAPLAELDGAGAVRAVFLYGTTPYVPDAMTDGASAWALVHDARGSVRLVVDAFNGAVVQRLDYDAFGRVVADSNPGAQPFGFAGGIHDPDTGLVRFGLREYDPETGRFMTPAPIEARDLDPYLYAAGDPVGRVDPIGADDIGLTNRSTVESIVQHVAANPKFQDVLDTVLPQALTGNMSGTIRNGGYLACLIAAAAVEKVSGYDPSYGQCDNAAGSGEAEEGDCVGIADLAEKIIGASLAELGIQNVGTLSRPELFGAEHTAVVVTFRDGEKAVIDWHQRLDPKNPVVQTVDDWILARPPAR